MIDTWVKESFKEAELIELRELLETLIDPQLVNDAVEIAIKYKDRCVDQAIADTPNCDDCERIHPDDIGDYVADHREAYYDR